jgi:hypothetical protein
VTGCGKQSLGRAVAPAGSPGRDEAVYDRHAARLYRQALLTLGDAGLAERVVSDVITDECLRSSPRDPDGEEYRLGVSVCRRCHELATDPAWWNRLSDPFEGMPGRLSPGGVSVRERAALALVIFGHLGYVEAAGELEISPLDMAALLLAVLHKLTAADMAV